MNTCKDCKHWVLWPDNLYGDCASVLVGDLGLANQATAWVDPITTGPDFGCIHWEQK